MSQVNVRNLTGEAGGKLIDSTSGLHQGKWCAIQFTQDSIISSIESNIDTSSSSFVNLGVPGGLVLFGITTAIQLGAGSAICYDHVE